MAIRIGLYDFFAYTIPGVFYLLVAGYAAGVFGFVQVDWATLNGLSLGMLILLVGAGYVTGVILNSVSIWWSRLFRQRSTKTLMLQAFERSHPHLQLNFLPKELGILFQTLIAQNREVILNIERFNVTSIMLRNISLGLALLALVYVAYFVLRAGSSWNLVLTVMCLLLSVLAARLSKTMREWFYLSIYEATAAHALKEFQWIDLRPSADHPEVARDKS